MNIPEYNTGIPNNLVSNLAQIVPKYNDGISSTYDYLYDTSDQNTSYAGGQQQQHLATMLQQFFSKISDNQTAFDLSFGLSSQAKSSGSLSLVSSLPSSANDANSYRFLALISLWFVLLINPIVILFGVVGNLCATYILINCNIFKLPVSFYTIMLNISDTLNLLIPVFIFWLDNCFNRTPERGYFRDKSNFLCKALMCPDQLFAALSAWYMCAISFNRWYSVWRPSSYFIRQSFQAARAPSISINTTNINDTNCEPKKYSSGSVILPSSSSSSLIPFCFHIDCCYCISHNIKYRQHLQAFRSIGLITLVGILCCLYPIFMHEIRPIISTNQHYFDLRQQAKRTYAVVWKRCYYSQKHEYAYDIIGIILSCLLHVLPLTFVAVMNIMIILRLRQRQRQMSNASQPSILIPKKQVRVHDPRKGIVYLLNPLARQKQKTNDMEWSSSSQSPTTHKDQSTSTDLPNRLNITVKLPNRSTPRRHHSRDRNITIMLVTVALSYLILTIPYRLFWSYNVYIKRMHPEKLNSSIYLLKMHYIDHLLRTIRNIHYGTNFIFFIYLSKAFRRKFQQLFLGKFLHASNQLLNPNSIKRRQSRERPSNLEETNNNDQSFTPMKKPTNTKEQMVNETASLIEDAQIREEQLHSIVELEHDDRLAI